MVGAKPAEKCKQEGNRHGTARSQSHRRVCPRGAESYTWQEGDTAERIARTYATTVQALQVINPGVDFAT